MALFSHHWFTSKFISNNSKWLFLKNRSLSFYVLYLTYMRKWSICAHIVLWNCWLWRSTINAVTIFTYDTSLVTVFLDLLKAFDSTSGGILTIPFIIAYLMLLWTSSGAVFQREYNIWNIDILLFIFISSIMCFWVISI